MIPQIYVAGPYRGKNAWEIERNIHEAKAVGPLVLAAGGFPVIPHANTAHFDGLVPDEVFLAGTLGMMLRCDGVWFLQTWEASSGARAEHAMAVERTLPIWYLGNPLGDSAAAQAAWMKALADRVGAHDAMLAEWHKVADRLERAGG